MHERCYTSYCEEDTLEVGRQIGRSLSPPQILLLRGDLGSGKTVLTRGIVAGLGAPDSSIVHSPTFSLVNEYETPRTKVYHLDLYRLDTRRDQDSVGLEEILALGGIVIVEWSEKLKMRIDEASVISLEMIADDSRRITFYLSLSP